jgi:hypothetical protein
MIKLGCKYEESIFLLKRLLRYSFNERCNIHLCLLNSATCSYNYIATDVRVTVNNEMASVWKKALVA